MKVVMTGEDVKLLALGQRYAWSALWPAKTVGEHTVSVESLKAWRKAVRREARREGWFPSLNPSTSLYASMYALATGEVTTQRGLTPEKKAKAREYLSVRIPVSTMPKYLKWLDMAMAKSHEPLEDVLPLIPAAEKKRVRVGDIMRFKTVNQLSQFLASLDDLSPEARKRHEKDATILYDSPQFIVVFPWTRGASMIWGENTDWCTARKPSQGENLFLDYILSGTFLYYVIDKRTGRKYALGVNRGFVEFDGINGGTTVADNNLAFTEQDARALFKKEYGNIILAVEKHYAQSKGRHRVHDEVEVALEHNNLTPLFEGLSVYSKLRLADSIREAFHLWPGTKTKADKAQSVLNQIVVQMLDKLSQSKRQDDRLFVAFHREASEQTYMRLARDDYEPIRARLAFNPHAPERVLRFLAQDEASAVKRNVYYNASTPKDVRMKLKEDTDVIQARENPDIDFVINGYLDEP